MPERRRTIFLALRLDGASYAELAERTGLSVRQIERELAPALVQLRRAVREGACEPRWRRWFCFLAERQCPWRRASPAAAGEAVRTGLVPLR